MRHYFDARNIHCFTSGFLNLDMLCEIFTSITSRGHYCISKVEITQQAKNSRATPSIRACSFALLGIRAISYPEEERLKCLYLLDRADTPGNSFPSRSSRLAPPPVET